jgi:hypothetical protein
MLGIDGLGVLIVRRKVLMYNRCNQKPLVPLDEFGQRRLGSRVPLQKIGIKDVVVKGNYGPVYSPKSKLLLRRNPLIEKPAVKQVAIKKTAKFIQDFNDAQKLLKDLELDLSELKKKLNALCHDPLIAGPKRPSLKK